MCALHNVDASVDAIATRLMRSDNFAFASLFTVSWIFCNILQSNNKSEIIATQTAGISHDRTTDRPVIVKPYSAFANAK